MSGVLWSLAGFIVALGILVAIHEYGHFWVARKLGVKVLRYSIGFGSRIWSRVSAHDGTEYALSAIPLGGYVKMLDENEGPVPPKERHRAFNRQPIWKRVAIVLAGPGANFLFAIFAYWIAFMVGVMGIKPIVGEVSPGSLAAQAGIQPDDEIILMDGRQNRSWGENRIYLFDRAFDGGRMPITVRGVDGQERELELDLTSIKPAEVNANFLEERVGLYGKMPLIPAVIGTVQEDSAAADGGLEPGDLIVEIAGEPIGDWRDLVGLVQSRAEQDTAVTIERGGEQLTLTVRPRKLEVDGRAVGIVGITPAPVDMPEDMFVRVSSGPLMAIEQSIEQTWLTSVLTLKMLYKMLTLEVSTKNISGPLTIAQYAGQSAQIGINRFILFLALVSISLGILNLLPIPVLDGGHLVYYIIEAIKGSPLSERSMIVGQNLGFAVLAGLMCLAFYNDISRILFGL